MRKGSGGRGKKEVGKKGRRGVGGGGGGERKRDFLDNFKFSENILLIFSFILKVNLCILHS